MIRQAHTYLVGAMSGATLIAIAIAVFVLLVSAQVFRDWPIAALGDDDTAAVSDGHPAAGSATGPTGAAAQTSAGGGDAAKGDGAATKPGPDGPPVLAPGPSSGQPVSSGQPGSGGGGQGGGSGNSAPAHNPSSPSSPGPSSGKTSGGGGGSSQGSSPSSQVTETVNSTVNQVDETALGGTLKETGVTEAAEGVVNGVAGPESAVGHVVDETVGAVGGLLNGNR
jgi:hypothetical protein